jgi:hypothetical protein
MSFMKKIQVQYQVTASQWPSDNDLKIICTTMLDSGMDLDDLSKERSMGLPEGWSDTLLDILEDKYQLETKLLAEFKILKKISMENK